MANAWFAGNYCPANATCSTTAGALTTKGGITVRTFDLNEEGEKDAPYIGEVRAFPEGAPEGWIPCKRVELPIANYTALFAILEPLYGGGQGRAIFMTPDLDNQPVNNYFICAIGTFPERQI